MRKSVPIIFSIVFFGLTALVFPGEIEENLKNKGLHVADMSDEDKINLQVNRLEQAIRQQWIGEIQQMLSPEYKESDSSISAPNEEELENIFSNLSSVRQFATQTNPQTGWKVTCTQDFYIRDLEIQIEEGTAVVECDIGFFSAGQDFEGIRDVLSFTLENREWVLSGSEGLFGFLKSASEASIEEIGTISFSSDILNEVK